MKLIEVYEPNNIYSFGLDRFEKPEARRNLQLCKKLYGGTEVDVKSVFGKDVQPAFSGYAVPPDLKTSTVAHLNWLWPQQEDVGVERVKMMIEEGWDGYPLILRNSPRQAIVLDGHNRIVAQILGGRKSFHVQQIAAEWDDEGKLVFKKVTY